MAENLLVTKFYIPSPTLTHTPRLRLFKSLDEGLRQGRRLTLISAPAGYGKTTLISEWIHFRKLAAAWLSIDEGDNDPVRFTSYLIAAIQTKVPAVGDVSTDHSSPGESLESDLVLLINRLAKLPGKLLVVLDDYHAIHVQSIHDAMSFFIENLPPQIQIIIATRADPPLSIARLRARGMLNELRMSDMRFSVEEAGEYLNQVMGLSLSPDDIAGLDRRIEGWAAGLQMLALTYSSQSVYPGMRDSSDLIRSFTGSTRYILDYFVEEVLERQPEAMLTFLQHTSILERLCAPLCDAVTGIRDWSGKFDQPEPLFQAPISSGKILEHLDRANLFIVLLDDRREWYRYHRLFADLLKQRLHLLDPEIVPLLHQRASLWFEQQQLFDEAIHHGFAAGDMSHVAELIEAAAENTLMRGEIATFLAWIERLPGKETTDRPDLIVYYSLALLWSGAPLELIENNLALIQRSTALTGREAPLRAFIALNQGQISMARDYCRKANELLPESDQLFRGWLDLMQAICYMVEGDELAGIRMLEEAAIVNQKVGNLMVANLVLYQLAELRQKEGRFSQAQSLYQRALDLARDSEGHYLPIAGRALVGLGEIAWAWNQVEDSQRYLLDGIALSEEFSKISAFDGYLALLAIKQSLGEHGDAEKLLRKLRKIAEQFDLTEIDDLVVDLMEARLRIAQGDLAAVHQWTVLRGLEGKPASSVTGYAQEFINQRLYKYEILVLARLWMAEGRYDEALEILDQQLTRLDNIDRPVLVIETELLRALAYQERGEPDQALLALKHALALTEPEGYLRIFLDGGDKIRSLLMIARPKVNDKQLVTFIDKLLHAFPAQPRQAEPLRVAKGAILVEPLSDREIDVLRLLPSRLSSQEMADELFISIHTLRSHLKSIYGKLIVHSRYEAISRAQELGLL